MCQECSNYGTIAHISQGSKVMLKFCKLGFNSTWTENFQIFKLDLEKARGTRDQIANICWVMKTQENSRKTSNSASLTTLKPLTVVDHNKLWKILQEMGITDHLTCL